MVRRLAPQLDVALNGSRIHPREPRNPTGLAAAARASVDSDSGSVFKAKQARLIYAALGIRHDEIDRRQPWQNYIETHFNVMCQMADHHYARARSWPELQAAHARFFADYNGQPHFAHQARPLDRQSPAAVLGWVQGAWCDPADLDRLFRLRAARVLNAHGYVRFRHWRLYGERDLAGERAAVWVWDDTLTIEHAAETLAQSGTQCSVWRPIVVARARTVDTRHGSSQRSVRESRGAHRLAGQVGEAREPPFAREARAHGEEGLQRIVALIAVDLA
jgi:hypothetical protein